MSISMTWDPSHETSTAPQSLDPSTPQPEPHQLHLVLVCQSQVMPPSKQLQGMSSWHEFLGEMEHILNGTKLIPFWRGIPGGVISGIVPMNAKYGINLRRVFTEPQRFDLVLWIQGTAAQPYLEEGERTDPAVWARLGRVFRGEFFGFAIWFN